MNCINHNECNSNSIAFQYLRPTLVEIKSNASSPENFDRLGLLETKLGSFERHCPNHMWQLKHQYEVAFEEFLKDEGFHQGWLPASRYDLQGFYVEKRENIVYLTDTTLPLPLRDDLPFRGAHILVERLCSYCADFFFE